MLSGLAMCATCNLLQKFLGGKALFRARQVIELGDRGRDLNAL